MKKIIIGSVFFLSACMSSDPELQAHLEAERDFAAHQNYLESIYSQYDPEYVDDCLYYEELVCEFE